MRLYGNNPKRGSRAAPRAGRSEKEPRAAVSAEKSSVPRKKRRRGPRRVILLMLTLAVAVLVIGATVFLAAVRPPDIDRDEPETTAATDAPANDENAITVSDVAKRKEDFLTLLVCGTDQDKTRTDTIIFAAFDIKKKQMHLLNIPRDTISNVERSIRKINSAYAVGGIDQLKKEVRMLVGVPVDRYIVLDFKGFAELVDAVGGLEYNVPITMKYDDPTQNLHIDIKKGLQPLNGETALQFMRFRQNNADVGGGYADGDLGRIRAQQEFIKALAKKLLKPENILKVPDIANAVLNNTKTDLTLGQLLWLGLETVKIDPDTITAQLLPGYDKYLYEPRIKMNQSYYIPKEAEIIELVNSVFNPYTDPVTALDIIDINKESAGITSSSKASETKVSDTKAADTAKPEQTKPEETKPEETKPEETKPEETDYPPIGQG